MKNTHYSTRIHTESRRDFISRFTGGVLVLACSPLITLGSEGEGNKLNEQDVFRSFVLTVVPDADRPTLDLSEFYSTRYPFYRFIKMLVRDLGKTSRFLYKTERFEKLSEEQRMTVLSSGCKKPVMGRLYKGGIWFVQVLVFTGLAYENRYSGLIDFDGNKTIADKVLKEPVPLFARSITQNGNLP